MKSLITLIIISLLTAACKDNNKIDNNLTGLQSYYKGLNYYYGIDCRVNKKIALEYFKQSVLKGAKIAKPYVTNIYVLGENVDKNMKEALKWERKETTNSLSTQQESEAFNYLFSIAKNNNDEAYVMVAESYYQGWGTPKDYKKAFYYFEKMAIKDYPMAQSRLGRMYGYGKGVKKDLTKAIYWTTKAAENELPYDQFILGKHYKHKKEYKKAFVWFLKSAEQDFPNGQYAVGYHYFMGRGVLSDKKKSAYWIKKAYNNGSTEAKDFWENNELWKYE